jgi:hypothetical protein
VPLSRVVGAQVFAPAAHTFMPDVVVAKQWYPVGQPQSSPHIDEQNWFVPSLTHSPEVQSVGALQGEPTEPVPIIIIVEPPPHALGRSIPDG